MAARITHHLTVAEGDAGQRVDRYLAARLPELSRTRIQELIDAGLVLVTGKVTKGAYKLRVGEEIVIEARERPPMQAEPEAIPLVILYEDDDVLVVNKPAAAYCDASKSPAMPNTEAPSEALLKIVVPCP